LGLGIVRKLAVVGYRVIAIARRESEELTRATAELEPRKSGVLNFKPFDLTNTGDIRLLVKHVRDEFGPIYGLVNNAGIGFSGLLTMMPDSQIGQLIHLNTVSPVLLTKYVVRGMMVDGGGRIVNIASIVGFAGYRGLTVYSATKASIIGFTCSFAREVGALGITVNAVAPGFVDTNMTEALTGQKREQIVRRSALLRLAEIEDIANAVEFLLGRQARNITGTVLTVDAGNTA
jgi:3-oxoacyl-[acyl-carrier protein] reductase